MTMKKIQNAFYVTVLSSIMVLSGFSLTNMGQTADAHLEKDVIGVYYKYSMIMIPADSFQRVSVFCNSGDVATGGGFYNMSGDSEYFLNAHTSYTYGQAGWQVWWENEHPNLEMRSYTIVKCLDITP